MNYIACFSGGKDSTAMVLRLIEEKKPLNYVLHCDTGLDFPEIQETVRKIKMMVEANGIDFVTLKAERDFEYWCFEHLYTDRSGVERKGYGFARGRSRWCTKSLKNELIRKFKKSLGSDCIEYVGLASDEQYRLLRKSNKVLTKKYPLVDWGMTEKDCLQYCYDRGFDFGGLYQYFDRISCWCCPLQSLSDLRNLYHHFPELWKKLEDWQQRTDVPFKQGYSVQRLRARFELEDKRLSLGLPISARNKDFSLSLSLLFRKMPIQDRILDKEHK